MALYGVLLSGGMSSRMKQDKGALPFCGKTLRDHHYHNLQQVCERAYISLRPEQLVDPALRALDKNTVILDALPDIGPAAALLAAYEKHPEDHGFFVACDFPLADVSAFSFLLQKFLAAPSSSEITCYVHGDGTPEPLFSVWKPSALARLKLAVAQGRTGPMSTLRQCEPLLIRPTNELWLLNANTPEEWAEAQRRIRN